jgi:hypothetical protein
MMSFLRFATLVLLLAGASAFQTRLLVASPTGRSVIGIHKAATSDDLDKSPMISAATSNSSDSVTDLDKATFQMAKEYLSTGIPDDSATKEPEVGGFTM